MTTAVDAYLEDGCGRCAYYKTPRCKVNFWPKELTYLRNLILDCGLHEELKWSVPCYTHNQKNILLLSAFKDYVAISFFKGVLLDDEFGLLVQQTENVQATPQLRFTSLADIIDAGDAIKAYIYQAIEVEESEAKVPTKAVSAYQIPAELDIKFNEDPAFRNAFYALTPGRQKGYLLHFGQPKQAKTRMARIEKYVPQIFAGDGMHDAYRRANKK